ncbi:MAG: TrmH family RNA methyltransferase [Acidimicrobiales bacterium]
MGSAPERPVVLGARHRRVVEVRRLVRHRGRRAEVVLEGRHIVTEAIEAGSSLVTVVVAESGWDDPAVAEVVARIDPVTELILVRDHVLEGLATTTTPQPMLAIAERPEVAMPSACARGALALVLIEVSDPGNTGTIIRAADAVAADLVVTVGGADPWGPKAVRASAGSVLHLPVVCDPDPIAVLTGLRSAGYAVVAADVRHGRPHHSGVLGLPAAIVLGSEARGLPRVLEPMIDRWTRIEMPGRAESLNVAMAATLLAFEARRAAPAG